MGIEPTMPLLAQSIIGFEDRGRHQFGTRFRHRPYTFATPLKRGGRRNRRDVDGVASTADVVRGAVPGARNWPPALTTWSQYAWIVA